MGNSREQLPVELVDATGVGIGTCTVTEAHTAPGRLHRAFSVQLVDPDGRLLLQRRAPVKTRFASRWSNTCCGHPAPGQRVEEAAVGRLAEELGLTATLTEVGSFTYRAADTGSGFVEHEWDHVLLGTLTDGEPAPDPAEVSDYTWLDPAHVHSAMADDPHAYTPWLSSVLRLVTAARH
ncbi:isopentenyl-diphosphate delta-isomerase [Herbihabitans rhizosphaerae]|uniref:Isopentenyl-diphosphate Delta-isomerase n=1 Tax=Herbihabitans rhizosphaerae TaxID=1872711 RepID=A0A4Q7KJA2_9PSEU|nr:isopentenyl-diphosphate Delta-isomerase [Herbihabitans rhizosphaerae]RZS33946.1 isopentenyl-diphosphate delta-isomerase [Herbihabitans rhizosphaerae]